MIRTALALVLALFVCSFGCEAASDSEPSLAVENTATGDAGGGYDAGNGADISSSFKDVALCVPNCSNRQCGDNGCGGTCGNCGNTKYCNWQTGACETPPLQTVDVVQEADTSDSVSEDAVSSTDAVAPATTDVVGGQTDIAVTPDQIGQDAADTVIGTDTVSTPSGTDAVGSTTDVATGTDAAVGTDATIDAGSSDAADTQDTFEPFVKPMVCTITSLSKANFTFYGSGVSNLAAVKSGWSFPISSENHEVFFSTGDLPYASFNMSLGSVWAYGADYMTGGYVLNGDWGITCEGIALQFKQATFSKATCGDVLAPQSWCVWSSANDHRIVVRFW